MDNQLLSIIHKFAEDREIGYIEAKTVGEQYGMKFENEDQLREWKQKIDRYLGTFEVKDFNAIEEACKPKKSKKKSKQVTEAYNKPSEKTGQKKAPATGQKQAGKSPYTEAQLAKLRKAYGVKTNEKALEMAIRDKKRGVDPLAKKQSIPQKRRHVEESKRRGRRKDEGEFNINRMLE